MVGNVPGRRRRAGLDPVDDDHEDRRRRRHARADLRARRAPAATSCAARATRRKRPKGLAQIVPRSPVPIVADIHFQYKLALAAMEAGVQALRLNPGNIRKAEHIKLVARRGQGPRPPDPHRRERGFARSRDGRAARRHHARGARRVGDARARPVPRSRLRRREDLGEGVERAADDRLVPAARRRRPTIRCTSASPKPARCRRARSRASPASARCWPKASATRSASRSPPIPVEEAKAGPHAARSARAARAQGPRPDRVPVVRARRGRRHPASRPTRRPRSRSATSRCRSR